MLRRFLLSLFPLCLLTVASLSGSAAIAHAATRTLTPISIGIGDFPPKMTDINFWVAKDEGFFARQGLNVQLVPFNNGIESLQGVAGGHIDFGATATADVLAAVDRGGRVVNVWGHGVPLDTVLLTPQSIRTPRQLKGAILAWGGPGSFAELNMDAVLQAAHLKESDVHFVTMNRPEFVPAIVAGKIQGAIFHEDDGLTAMSKDPNLHILARIHNLLPNWWYAGLACSAAYARTHRALVVRVIEAMDLADRWMYTHPRQVIALAVRYTHEPYPVIAKTYRDLAAIGEWSVNTGLEPKYVDYTIAGELKLGWITHHLTYGQVADPSYAKAALKVIGTVPGY